MIEGIANWFVKGQIKPSYKVLMSKDSYELRKYDPWVVAQTVVESTHENAGNVAFGKLGGYIFGKNEKEIKIEMTAPVSEYEVGQGKYAVQFFMPPEWNLTNLPRPIDSNVQLKNIEGKTYFVKKYNAGWSESEYQAQLTELKQEARLQNIRLKENAEPVWARYNPPFMPAPLRTNQIWVEAYEQ